MPELFSNNNHAKVANSKAVNNLLLEQRLESWGSVPGEAKPHAE